MAEEPVLDVIGGNAQARLKSIVERVERLESEKADLTLDLKEVYLEAKGNGFDNKIIRKMIALRKRDAAQVKEEQALLELYFKAIGDPLFT